MKCLQTMRWLRMLCLLCATGTMMAAQEKSQTKIALTFDDLPEIDNMAPGMTRLKITQAIIRALQDAHAPQVYGFVNAGTLVDEPELIGVLQAWRDAGFLLGNHTYSHANFDTKTLSQYEREIADDEAILRRMMAGQDWHWFRFPFLYEGDTMAKRNGLRAYLAEHGYRVAQVTMDFQDYDWNDPYARCVTRHEERAIGRLKRMYLANAAEAIRMGQQRARQVYGRDIAHVMLLHNGGIEAVMLPSLIRLLRTKGFELVTLDEAESDPAYALDPGLALKLGGTLQEQMMAAKKIEDGPFRDTPLKELARMCR